jgi:hypothetical protein
LNSPLSIKTGDFRGDTMRSFCTVILLARQLLRWNHPHPEQRQLPSQ